jgi:hypothetical protein
VPENPRQFDARPRTGAQNQIEVAYAATTDADERLIRTRLGSRYLAHLENFRATKRINDHCLHDRHLIRHFIFDLAFVRSAILIW